ncbi:MAG TPA: polysaccharide biosynthesis/export family protein [Steroidobacteraceae bacterium]|nr:polysaccharide biosynthesis/export family protein [Steroidobacteraceae bacterium]
MSARSMRTLSLMTGLALLFMCRLLLAAAPPGAQPGAKSDAPLVQLGIGDEVRFQVYGQPDMDTVLTVADDGNVTIPLAGPVQVSGLSLSEAATQMEQSLKKGGYLVNPHVTLTVMQSRSQRVSVLGEVRTPGRYVIDSGTTIFDLLAQAGGITPNGASRIYLIREGQDGKVARYPINLRGLDSSNFSLPVETLRAGDSIYVPAADHFYIQGEVTKPGQYTIDPDMTLLQAIVKAGGITQRGSSNRVTIKRHIKDKYKTFSASMSEQIQPDDVIEVKESIF